VFQHLFLSPLFVIFTTFLILSSLTIIFYFGPRSFFLSVLLAPRFADSPPRYGSQNMIWYILVCSLIGGLSVSVTTGLGAAIVRTILGDNQVGSPSPSKLWNVPDIFLIV
jgi:magnesium transporter